MKADREKLMALLESRTADVVQYIRGLHAGLRLFEADNAQLDPDGRRAAALRDRLAQMRDLVKQGVDELEREKGALWAREANQHLAMYRLIAAEIDPDTEVVPRRPQ